MALYPIRLLKDKNRHPFFPFNTLESVLVDGTNQTLKDVLNNIYTKSEINTMFAAELSKVSVYTSINLLPVTARSGALAVVVANNIYTMYVFYENSWHALIQNGPPGPARGTVILDVTQFLDQAIVLYYQDINPVVEITSQSLIEELNNITEEKTYSLYYNADSLLNPQLYSPIYFNVNQIYKENNKYTLYYSDTSIAITIYHVDNEWYLQYYEQELETVFNKTTNITSSSTDFEYPSAKAVYTALPKQLSELSNANTKFVNETQLQQAIAALGTVFTLKGSVTTASALPSQNNNIGDVYYVEDASSGYVWIDDNNTERWEELGPTIDTSNFLTKLIGAYPIYYINSEDHNTAANAFDFSEKPAGLYIVYPKTFYSNINQGPMFYAKPRSTANAFSFTRNCIIFIFVPTVLPTTYVNDTTIYIIRIGNTLSFNAGQLIDKGNRFAYPSSPSYSPFEYYTVGIGNNQTISGVKTFSALPKSSVTPTDNDHLTRKGYVDDKVSNLLDIQTFTFSVGTVGAQGDKWGQQETINIPAGYTALGIVGYTFSGSYYSYLSFSELYVNGDTVYYSLSNSNPVYDATNIYCSVKVLLQKA